MPNIFLLLLLLLLKVENIIDLKTNPKNPFSIINSQNIPKLHPEVL